jgi:uncharacterized protein YndB with AHSA1/START domain
VVAARSRIEPRERRKLPSFLAQLELASKRDLRRIQQGKRLDFTWKWDHETVEQVLVRLNLEPTQNGGTKLTLHHGVYPANPEGKKNRDEHIEGWTYFLGKLREATDQLKS